MKKVLLATMLGSEQGPAHALSRVCPAAWLAVLALFLLCTWPSAAAENRARATLNAYPPDIRLDTAKATQRMVVQLVEPSGITRDVTAQASYKLANPKLARMDRGLMLPVSDGRTELKISFAGETLAVPVTVSNVAVERAISFKLDVMPVFTRAGCNAGACHGTSRGKDGFH